MSLRAGRTSEWRRDSGLYPHGEEPYGAMRSEMEKIETWRKKWAAIFGKALNMESKVQKSKEKELVKRILCHLMVMGKETKKTGI